MSADSQFVVPRSFVELFIPPRAVKPTESWAYIAERYEFCEDFALSLVSHPRIHAEDDRALVLERIRKSLRKDVSLLSEAEAGWVVCRLDELLTHGTP